MAKKHPLDIAWEDAQNNRDKAGLAKLGQQLISVFELGKLWLSLKPGQCLVLCDDGSIYRGEKHDAKTEKMFKLKEKYKVADKIDTLRVQSDLKAAEEMYPMPVTGRRSTWDTRTRLASDSAKVRKSRGKKNVEVVDVPVDVV